MFEKLNIILTSGVNSWENFLFAFTIEEV